MRDYYDILGVSPAADEVAIRAAYRALMLKFHPDTNKSESAADYAKSINEAFAVLSDTKKRQAYDRSRELSGRSKQPSPTKPPEDKPFGATQPNNPERDPRSARMFAFGSIALILLLVVFIYWKQQQGPPQEAIAMSAESKRQIEALLPPAERGDLVAQRSLGKIYQNNSDYNSAFYWSNKAAEKGDAESQYIAGSLFEEGQVVSQNDAAAYKLYKNQQFKDFLRAN